MHFPRQCRKEEDPLGLARGALLSTPEPLRVSLHVLILPRGFLPAVLT